MMNGSHYQVKGNRVAMRRWFAASLLLATGVMVKVAAAGTISQSLVAQTPSLFVPMNPVRLLDTRVAPDGPIGVPTSAKLGPNSSLDLSVAGTGLAVPATATAALINITLDQTATLQSFLTVWPTGEPRPLASANNAQPGLIAANSMVAALGANGKISIYNEKGSVDVVIDVVGYLVPATGGLGGGITVGSGAPAASQGNNGDYYLDASSHILYGPKASGVWPLNNDLDGGGISRYNTAALAAITATPAGTPIPFATLGPVYGSFLPPTTASTATTLTVGSNGVFEVEYRLDATSTGIGVVQVYVNDTAQGPGSTIALGTVLATDNVLARANAGDTIQLRFTGSISVLTSANSSSMVTTQVDNS